MAGPFSSMQSMPAAARALITSPAARSRAKVRAATPRSDSITGILTFFYLE